MEGASEEIKAKVVAATEEGVDRSKIQEEIDQLKDQLTSIASAASFSGENWLQADLTAGGAALQKNVVASFVRDETGAVSVQKVNYTVLGDAVHVTAIDTTGLVVPGSGRAVTVLGLDDVVVVDTPDAVLVTTRARAQDLKRVVTALQEGGRGSLT